MRLPHVIAFDRSPLYFFTACTRERQPRLANRFAFDVLAALWRKSGELNGWYVGRFVLMPDHVHFFAMSAATADPRGSWLKMWKSVSARRLAAQFNLQPPFWQEDTFDHILRGHESYREKWNYVRQNPVRAKLCPRPEDWLWQGEIHPLRVEG